MKIWAALDAVGIDADMLAAELDALSLTALEERDGSVRAFFADAGARQQALALLSARAVQASAVDVPDEDWARRSQENITPILVGRIRVTPPWHARANGDPDILEVVIEPSMGFGTGHHATTRLCLRALQRVSLAEACVLDVGTGSGVLAIAAAMLGAREAAGIDYDADAIQNARENLALNPMVTRVTFAVGDIDAAVRADSADAVTANLTGALLERTAPILLAACRSGGALILSGLMTPERPAVERAFAGAELVDAFAEDEWAALILRAPNRGGARRSKDVWSASHS